MNIHNGIEIFVTFFLAGVVSACYESSSLLEETISDGGTDGRFMDDTISYDIESIETTPRMDLQKTLDDGMNEERDALLCDAVYLPFVTFTFTEASTGEEYCGHGASLGL